MDNPSTSSNSAAQSQHHQAGTQSQVPSNLSSTPGIASSAAPTSATSSSSTAPAIHHHQQHHQTTGGSSNHNAPPDHRNQNATHSNLSHQHQSSSSANHHYPTPTSSQNLSQLNLPSLITTKAQPGFLASDRTEQPEVEIAYSDLRTIGNGSFGVVFQANLQRPTQEQIAIKKVLQDKRFKNRELQIMRKLDHCNVVKLKYFFHTHGDRNSSEVYLHLVLEYIPETLYKIARVATRNRQNLHMSLVKLYMYQLFRSLNYIHSMDICHRDIKPQNLLLNPETGVLKLCDFGSAKSLVNGEPNVAYICSRYYRAPELIFGATDYTTKIDIWSAGCVMAELILGETMFPGGNPVDQLVEIIKVLGTPSRDQLKAMNPNYTEFRFPVIKARSWNRIFSCSTKTPPEAAKLVSNLLEYTPSNRLSPLAACAHPFFDELRLSPTQRMESGREFPPLFNFSSDELKKEPDLANLLMPPNMASSASNPGGGSQSAASAVVASTSNNSSSSSNINNINNENTNNIISSSAATTQQIMASNSNNLIKPETSSSNVTGGSKQVTQPPNSHHHHQQQQQQSSQAHHGSKSSNTV